MPIDEPRWWYGDCASGGTGLIASWMPLLLQPAASVYGRVAVARYRKTAPYRSRLPVICVGNLVAGGTGKTPLALHIARLLQARGHQPAFLSRGYGGRNPGPHWVDPARDGAADVGDEPLLLAQTAPTVIARDRAAGARLIEQTRPIQTGPVQHAGRAPTHIVMDDGLQNAVLHKDLRLAMIDGDRLIGNGRVIPAGPLRAPLAFQAGLVDGLVISHRTMIQAGPELAALPAPLPAALTAYFDVPVIAVTRQVDGDATWLAGRPWIAFTGIGNPAGFFALLERYGAHLVQARRFADHHPFTVEEARDLLAVAARQRAGLVTTEKDWARLPADPTTALGDLKAAARVLRLSLSLAADDAAKLDRLLAKTARATTKD